MYITYTQQIINLTKLPKGFEITDFSIRVDCTGYMYVKHNNKYFEKIFTYDEMKLPVSYWIEVLPKIICNYFYGWAVKKGYRKL
jgi:hypothetical protein